MGSDAPPVAIRPRSLGSRPGTVIEFGSNKGASALWLADMLEVFGLRDTKVYSYDINPVTDLKDPRIVFGYCDTRDLSASLSDSFMRALPRPLLVIDDANPVFGLPAVSGMRDAIAKVPFIASFGQFIDDTSVHADLILPDHSFLESWVDSTPG